MQFLVLFKFIIKGSGYVFLNKYNSLFWKFL